MDRLKLLKQIGSSRQWSERRYQAGLAAEKKTKQVEKRIRYWNKVRAKLIALQCNGVELTERQEALIARQANRSGSGGFGRPRPVAR